MEVAIYFGRIHIRLPGGRCGSLKDVLKNLKLNEGNLGMALGVVVMVLAGFLLLNYFRTINRTAGPGQTSSASTEQLGLDQLSTENAQKSAADPRPGSAYVIQKGDSLWKISMKTYGTGYAWEKIYEANKNTIGDNPSLLASGTRINLPGSQPIEHTVQRGDNLWNISVSYCGTGTRWESISQTNNLVNPRIIQPGTVLRISCK